MQNRLAASIFLMDNDRVFKLLARIQAGDEFAFRELYTAHSRMLYAYVLRQLSDPGRAEEVVSDTLYEVWRQPGSFNGTAKFSTWLIGIARNKVLMLWRSRKPDSDYDDVDELADVLPSDDLDAFDLIAERQRREGVQTCLGKLSTDHREAIHLVFYEGLSVGEIAQVQGCPEGTVKTRLFHARQKLKICMRLLIEREGGTVPGGS
jgi:RNA polymerase sigma-70 factor (ECF subfamily)